MTDPLVAAISLEIPAWIVGAQEDIRRLYCWRLPTSSVAQSVAPVLSIGKWPPTTRSTSNALEEHSARGVRNCLSLR